LVGKRKGFKLVAQHTACLLDTSYNIFFGTLYVALQGLQTKGFLYSSIACCRIKINSASFPSAMPT